MLRIVVALCLVGATVCGPPVSRSRSEIEKFCDFLESTRTERGVVVGENILNPEASVWENSGKFQGDILLDDVQLESMVEQFAQGRNAYIWPGTLWPNRVIVYEFAAGFTQAQRDHILYSIRVLEDRTCIRFRPRNWGEFNYVLITRNSDGCYASVGYWYARGVHTMNLAPGCFNTIVIIHEWLHVIGFFHMQSTHNRYDYVRINWGNIVRGMEHNFDRLDTNVVSNLGLAYEYDSCMHYGAHAFTMNGGTTIDALRAHSGIMGQQSYVTGADFWRVGRLYGCEPWRTVEDYEPLHIGQAEAEFAAFQAELRLKEQAEETVKVEAEERVKVEAEETVKVEAEETYKEEVEKSIKEKTKVEEQL